MKKCIVLSTILLLFLFSFSLFGNEEPKYTNDSFARLSYINGSAYIQRGPELGYEEGLVNMPIEEGDRLGTTEGRAEIYLGKNNYVRLDNNTKLDFLSLPKKGTDLIRLRVWAGNIYLSVNRLDKEKSIEIHTPDSSFYILERGLYRIDVGENEKTEILVFRGVGEAAGEEGSLLLKSEQSLEVAGGRFSSQPKRFYAVAEDSFDRWSESRESYIQADVAKPYLPEELEDFENELEENGDWMYLKPYGWVWVPGGVDAEWRPYYNGRWTWLSMSGWNWIPYEPWGWATCHYGRWHWGVGMGWYWIPDPFWGPAWVSWWWGLDYYGWAPMSWWGYPVVVVDGWFYGHDYGRYYPYNSRALTVIRKDQLKAKNIPGVALKSDSLKSLNTISLSSQAPSVRPGVGKVTVQGLEGNKLLLRKETGELAPGSAKSLTPRSIGKQEAAGSARGQDLGQQRIQAPEKRMIRRPDSPQRSGAGDTSRSAIRQGSFGYPPSPKISLKKYSGESRFSKSSTFRSRLYQYLQGNKSSSRSSSSRGSISKGSSSSSRSGGSVSSGSRGSSSGSRSSGSSSSGSRSSGGGVKKK